jgi:hypothetical protein
MRRTICVLLFVAALAQGQYFPPGGAAGPTGPAGAPGTPVNSVQFNNPLGTFAGSADFTWDDAHGSLVLPSNQALLVGVTPATVFANCSAFPNGTTQAGHLVMGPDACIFEGGPQIEIAFRDTPAADLITSDGRVYIQESLSPSVDTYGTSVLEVKGVFGGSHHFTGIGALNYGLSIIDSGTTVDSWARMRSSFVRADKGTVAAELSVNYTNSPFFGFGSGATPVITTYFHEWIGDIGAVPVNGYAFWYDAPGVYRIKADGVMAYYNPAFTKYTPGAADYERVVQQWNSNVLEYGAEKGGSGTLRVLRFIGASVELPGTTFKLGALTCAVVSTVLTCT